jgi:hypothetical protein
MRLWMIMSLLLFLLSSCGPIWMSPSYYTDYDEIIMKEPILSSRQYSLLAGKHNEPYVVTIPERMTLFGAKHTKDPNDPQIDSIEALWKKLKPTIALVEGRQGFLFRWFSDPIENYGEGGLVADLAKEYGVPYYTWEPPFELEVREMLLHYSQKRVALFYILRPYFGQMKFGKPSDPDEFVAGTIGRRTKIAGLEGSISSIAEIDSLWDADFSGRKDWRDTDDRNGWPGYLNDIAASSNAFRDEHFARVVIHLVQNGNRVFAVCGSSHAVKLEKTLISALRPSD